jgi:signal transduction histidine kinase
MYMSRRHYFKILKIAILILCCFLTTLSTKAQEKSPQQRLDSLMTADKIHPREDSIKLGIYRELYRQFSRMQYKDKRDEYVEKSIVLAKRINQKWYEGEAYYRRAMVYHGIASYQNAEENYFKAIDAYIAANDLDMVAGMYLNLGALYVDIPNYSKALEANQKAVPIFLKNGNESDLASCYVNISDVYKSLGQYPNALRYLSKALNYFSKEGRINRGLSVVYTSIGEVYFLASADDLIKMGINASQRNEKTLEFFNRGLKVAQQLDDYTVLGPAYENLGKVYEIMGKRDLALTAYQKAITYGNQDNNKTYLAGYLLALAKFYVQDQDFENAKPLLADALKIGEKTKNLELQQNAYELRSILEEKQGNYNTSLANYRKFIEIRDQIFNAEKEKEITRRQLQLDFVVKENEYRLKQQLTDGELQRQVLVAKQQQQELVLRQQQLALSDKEKSVQRLTFLKKEADLGNQQMQEQIKAKLDKQIKDKQIGLQETELRFNQNVNLFLGILVLVLFAVALYVYFTQRKTDKLNKIVLEQKQELEKLSKVKDRIFSVVSHDMRTPVNSLISFIQLLEGGNISQEKLTKYAGNLKNTLGYTSTMMENLLNWASSQMQGFKPHLENFDVGQCADEVANSMEAIASQKSINITNKIAQDTFCRGDLNMTSLVLRNLISNAIKFTPAGGNIIISSEVINNRVAFAIADTGIGLSAAQVTHFNENGVQEIGTSTLGTNKEKGTGIGLLLCKSFAAMMDGSLQVKSTAEGTVFTFSLPKSD